MDLLRERLKARGAHCAVLCGGGESSTSTTGATTTTNNADRRVAVQDGVAVSGDGSSYASSTYIQDNSNSSDAVVAMTDMGADIIRSSGAAVVELQKNAGAQNADAWEATMDAGARIVEKLIDKAGEGFGLAEKVVDSFQPNENKNTDAIKTAAIAAGVIGVAMIFGKKS